MKKISYLFVVTAIVSLSSCVVKRNAVPVSSLNTQINFTYEDVEYISEVTGTSTQSYLFGVLPIGGRRNYQGIFSSAFEGSVLLNGNNSRGLNNALYDALSLKPDADYIIPVTYKIETTHMPFGRKETIIVKAKAIKIRPKKAEPKRQVIEVIKEKAEPKKIVPEKVEEKEELKNPTQENIKETE